MFTVVTAQTAPPLTFWGKCKRLLFPPTPVVEERLFMGTPYTLIAMPQPFDYDVLSTLVRQNARNLVLSPQLFLPEGSPLGKLDATAFCGQIALNTALQILDKSRIPLYARSAGLIDEHGTCQDSAAQLVKYCPCVKVYTRDREQYQAFCEEMLTQYGAVVAVTEDLSALEDVCLIVSPAVFEMPQEVQLRTPILLSHPSDGNGYLIHSFTPLLTEEILQQIPDGVVATDFLAAAFRFNKLPSLSTFCGKSGCCKKHQPTPEDISIYISDEFYAKQRR